MEISAKITYPLDNRILLLFSAEERTIGRASYSIKEEGAFLIFEIQAPDSTALRACLTTITKVLSVWEATKEHGAARTNHN